MKPFIGKLTAIFTGCIGLLMMACVSPLSASEPFRVVVLDVGEGQSVLFRRGDRGVLVDTGHFGKARHVLHRIAAHGVTELDYLFLTHLHGDHASGYFRIREAFPDMRVIDSGHEIPAGSPDTVRWVYQGVVQDPYRRIVRAGDTITWRGVEIRVLWPEQPAGPDLNHHSLVLTGIHGKLSALIMGDAGQQVEWKLMNRSGLPERVGLFVAGHHGSVQTSSPEFLSALSPVFTVISVDTGNIRGYPDTKTISRLDRYSNRLFKTFRDGEICIEWYMDSSIPRQCSSER